MIHYIFGLDLGRVRDPSALCVLQRIKPEQPGPLRYRLGVLETYSESEPGIVAQCPLKNVDFYERLGWHICRMLASRDVPSPRIPFAGYSAVAVDGTGPGRNATLRFAGSEMDRLAKPLQGFVIRSGISLSSHESRGGFHAVTRIELLTTAQCAMDAKRIEFVKGLPLRKELDKQLGTVDFNPHANDPAAGATRPLVHDDLVMALALAVYLGDYLGTADTSGGVRDLRWE